MKYVNVIIDNNSDNTDNFFTYGCELDEVHEGSKVTVPFSRGNKPKDAYVFQEFLELSQPVKGLKYVVSADGDISLTAEMLETCRWMKRRYMCKYIDAISCFTPSGTASKRGKKRVPYKDICLDGKTAPQLNQQQQQVLGSITGNIRSDKHDIFLIHGVTGSGKTEIYIQTIEECLGCGKTAIMLVPEISLTTQMIERFMSRFGSECIAVLHSRLSQGERYDEWVRIKQGKVKIVIGARSAVFAPLENIGAIILDEEHESTYKSDMTPKYDTVEVALKRVKTYKGILVLGSATPSVVSSQRAKEGLYKRLVLQNRYNNTPLPEVSVVDMRNELKNGNKSVFSRQLYEEMDACMADGRQVILFLNRRGYSSFVSCRECGYVLKCPECGISLTYHKNENMAMCHYCGHKEAVPKKCPECGSKYIKHFGSGTERVEEEVNRLFPDRKALRLDLDTIKKKGSMDALLKQFEKKQAEILIGTQLVAKGLDFENVGLVGVITADTTLNIPDFRSPERAFQLVTQAAGRAGRGSLRGKVVIQTYSPEHYAVIAASKQDYDEFFNAEILMRRCMDYPPFCDLIQILVTSDEEQIAYEASVAVRNKLLKVLGKQNEKNIFEPQAAPISKISGQFRYTILLKCPKGSRNAFAAAIDDIRHKVGLMKKKKYLISVDVNPYSFL